MPADFRSPTLRPFEQVIEYGLTRGATPDSSRLVPDTLPSPDTRSLIPDSSGSRVLADLWDIERFFDCECSPARASRLREMNRTQRVPAAVACARCGDA